MGPKATRSQARILGSGPVPSLMALTVTEVAVSAVTKAKACGEHQLPGSPPFSPARIQIEFGSSGFASTPTMLVGTAFG